LLFIVFYFIGAVNIQLTGAVATREVTICQNSKNALFCGAYEEIQLLTVFWGRNDDDVCDRWKSWKRTCSSTKAFGILYKMCNGQKNCAITADTATLKNPCKWNHKFLKVTYICRKTGGGPSPTPTSGAVARVKSVCDDGTSFMSCPNQGDVMKILRATYENNDFNNVCTNHGNSWGSCMKDVKKLIQSSCEDSTVCVVKVMKSKYKQYCQQPSYVAIVYACVKAGPTPTPVITARPTMKSGIIKKEVCEGKSTVVTCFGGVVNILKASYGRHDSNACTSGTSIYNTTCKTDIIDVVKFNCENKAMCVVTSDAGIYGDPCHGTSKYVEFEYKCSQKGSGFIPTAPFIPPVPKITGQPTVNPRNAKCGRPLYLQSKVIGGKNAQQGSWPWQVAIYRSNGNMICGGSLINIFWVITAAHCFQDKNPDGYYVVLGEHDRTTIDGHENRHDLQRIIVHYSYGAPVQHDNDIALLKLKRPARMSKFISPVCLPSHNDDVAVDEECYISGWGKLNFPGHMYTKLQQASLRVVDQTSCRNKLYNAPGNPGQDITSHMICAGSKDGKSGCHGDSGGPFVCKKKTSNGTYWILKGLISWGSPRCDIGDMYTVLTNVKTYVGWNGWINYNLNN